MQIFGQVWLWSLGSFLLGALFTWLLLVRPARKRVAELEEMASRPPMQPPIRVDQPIGRPPNPDKFLDDLFETQKAAAAQRAANLPPLTPPPPPIPSGPPITAPPGIQGRLDNAPGPTAPPEPPIPADDSDTELSDNPFRSFAESTTVFVPPSNLPKPPDGIEPSGEDWFAKEDGQDPHLITDVEDDEQVDEGGTIFTQHTTPIPAEMIRSLDETPPPRPVEQTHAEPAHAQVPPESAAEQTQVYDTPPVPAQAEHGQLHADAAAQQAAEQSRHDAEALQHAAEQSRFDIAAQQMAAEQARYDAAAQQAAEQNRYDAAAQQAAEQSRYDAVAQQMAAEQARYDSLAQPHPADQGHYDPSAQQVADQGHYDSLAQPHPADQGRHDATAQHSADQGQYAAAAAHSAEQQVADQGHYDSFAPAQQPAAEPEPSRSLFEPVVPVAEESGAADDFVPPGPFGPGSAMPLPGGGSPAPEFNVKASVTALRYCTQDNPQFDRIVAEVWFRTPSDAERVGFRVLS